MLCASERPLLWVSISALSVGLGGHGPGMDPTPGTLKDLGEHRTLTSSNPVPSKWKGQPYRVLGQKHSRGEPEIGEWEEDADA